MDLRLIREPSRHGATLGSLYIDGVWAAWTLEDEIRELYGYPVDQWKVPGQTAIPVGRYKVIVTASVRFQRPLPLLVDVPGFQGVRIHAGNTIADTEGCLLVGLDRQEGRVLRSRVALEQVSQAIAQAQGDVWLRIEAPYVDIESDPGLLAQLND